MVAFSKRRGVSRTALIAVVVIVVAVLAFRGFIPSSLTGLLSSASSEFQPSTSANSSSSTSTAAPPLSTSRSAASTSSSIPASLTSSTCPSSTSLGSGTPNVYRSAVGLFGNFSAMSLNSTSSGTSFAVSYHVIYGPKSGASDYKVNFTSLSHGITQSGIAWFGTDGAVLAVMSNGQNLTGPAASGAVGGLVFGLVPETVLNGQLPLLTSSQYVHKVNQTTVTLGPTSFTVTNYAANSLPFTSNQCGVIEAVSTYAIQAGLVPGTGYTLVTYADTRMVTQAPDGTTESDIVLHLLSVKA